MQLAKSIIDDLTEAEAKNDWELLELLSRRLAALVEYVNSGHRVDSYKKALQQLRRDGELCKVNQNITAATARTLFQRKPLAK